MKQMNNNHSTPDVDAMLSRYLADNSDAEAIAALRKAAEASDDTRAYIRQQLDIWFASAACATEQQFDSDAAYRRFAERTRQATATAKWRHTLRRVAVAAAVAAVAVALPWAGYRMATSRISGSYANISIATPKGSTTEMRLPDGTRVWLNAGSHITYSQGFGVADRNVRLTGEACFDVAHNAKMPFVVQSNTARLQVLGTKFNYRDYPGDRDMAVDLIRGSVSLTAGKSGRSVRIKPNQRITLDKQSGRMTRQTVDASQSAAWTVGDHFFDEVDIAQIATTLERAYGVKISVAPSLRGCRFYCAFNTNDYTLDDVLRILANTHHVHYRQNGNSYTLY